MPDAIAVRRAAPSDLPVVAQLFDGYRQFYGQEPDLDRCSQFMSERLSNGDSYVLVALNTAGEGVGFTQLYPIFSSVRMAPVWILNDLFVHPSARGRGVASRLMKAAAAVAREHGVAGLQLETAADNEPAKALYDKLGWNLDSEFHHYSMIL